MRRGAVKRLERRLTNYRVVIIAIIAIIGGALLFLAAAHMQGDLSHAVAGIAATVLSVWLVALVYELWLRRSLVAEFLVASNLGADLAETGDSPSRELGFNTDWKAFFDDHPGDIDIVFSYGRTWSGTNADRVIRSAAKERARVTVTLLDPEPDGDLLEFYGETYQTSAQDLRNSIDKVVEMWKEAALRLKAQHPDQAPTLRIEGINRHMPYTFYRAGDYMWVIFSSRAPGRAGDGIPAILCRKTPRREGGGLYDWVINDLQACRKSGRTRILWETSK